MLDLVGGQWWRFTSYEIRGGYIRPTAGAKLKKYDPWKDRAAYQSIVDLRKTLTFVFSATGRFTPRLEQGRQGFWYDLAPESEDAINQWCAKHGLLGLLAQQAHSVSLAPRWEKGGGNKIWAIQRSFVRTNTEWMMSFAERHGKGVGILKDLGQEGELVSKEDMPESYSNPAVVIQSLGRVEVKREPLCETWGSFFPDVPKEELETYNYPLPHSNAFWQQYAEPVVEFLKAAEILIAALERVSLPRINGTSAKEYRWLENSERGIEMLNALLTPVGLALYRTAKGSFRQKWTAPSLLALFAAMALFDLTEGHLLRCANENCERLFVTDSFLRKYCSPKCRWAVDKRKQRSPKGKRGRIVR